MNRHEAEHRTGLRGMANVENGGINEEKAFDRGSHHQLSLTN